VLHHGSTTRWHTFIFHQISTGTNHYQYQTNPYRELCTVVGEAASGHFDAAAAAAAAHKHRPTIASYAKRCIVAESACPSTENTCVATTQSWHGEQYLTLTVSSALLLVNLQRDALQCGCGSTTCHDKNQAGKQTITSVNFALTVSSALLLVKLQRETSTPLLPLLRAQALRHHSCQDQAQRCGSTGCHTLICQ
jgi:hypothetical protein